MSSSEGESKNPHHHSISPSEGYPADTYAHTMSLSDLRLEEESHLPVTKEIREAIMKRAKEKSVSISTLLDILLRENTLSDAYFKYIESNDG